VKKKTIYICASCGYESAKWLGKCPSCSEFNSFSEETQEKIRNESDYRRFDEAGIKPLSEIDAGTENRIMTGIAELDRVLGGGIVKGSLVLVGGEPGAGKSTLALQAAEAAAGTGMVIYVSGEESLAQVKSRAIRLNALSKNLMIAQETSVEKISSMMEKHMPVLMVVDSIQTVYKQDIESAAGSMNQVRESCAQLMYAAKRTGIPVIIIGHVTKDGMLAGPKMLEHMVDVVLYFESEKYRDLKVLRAAKNRFGATNETGIFEMNESGLAGVDNPSKNFLSGMRDGKEGSAAVTVMEGSRPLIIEIQALCVKRAYGVAQRTVTGVDYNRFLVIVAVIEKNLGIKLENHDIFINVAGGVKINDTACDLGLAAAVYSSYSGKPLPSDSVFIGELGLDGTVIRAPHTPRRLKEASRMGFARAFLPDEKESEKGMKITKTENINSLMGKI